MGLAGAGLAVAAVGTAASVAGQLSKGSGQSGAISQGQEQARADVQPWVASGTSANKRQADLLGLNGQPAADEAVSGFQASPGYQYAVSQGLRAVDAGAAARGMVRSGATLRAEQTLGNNLADLDFGNYIDRLNKLSTTGESAGVNQATTDTGAATNQASIYGDTVKGVTNSLTTGLTNPSVQNGLTSLFDTSPSQSAASQYANPYGATGSGQMIVGSNGLMGGGV